MSWYQVRLSDSQARISTAVREAASEDALLRDLKNEGLYAIQVRRTQTRDSPATSRYRDKVILEFTDVLSELLDSGIKH